MGSPVASRQTTRERESQGFGSVLPPDEVSRTRRRGRIQAAGGRAENAQGVSSVSTGKEAVDLAQQVAEFKKGERVDRSGAWRTVAGRRFRKVGDDWIDQSFNSTTPVLRLRVMGDAYFHLLEQHPELSPILALGQRVTWLSPSGTAVKFDETGDDRVDPAILDRLFVERH
jgi:hypothetical protein